MVEYDLVYRPCYSMLSYFTVCDYKILSTIYGGIGSGCETEFVEERGLSMGWSSYLYVRTLESSVSL